jgi:hypothetical protein
MADWNIGDTIKLDSETRRSFMKKTMFTSGILTGINKSVGTALSKESGGVPLVHTYDRKNNPERIKLIPEERHRRIMVYENIDGRKFTSKYPFVEEIRLEQKSNDCNDLHINILVNEKQGEKAENLPDDINGVPVSYDLQTLKRETHVYDGWTSNCNDKQHDIEGGLQVGPESGGSGTICTGAYTSGGDPVVITAEHVGQGADLCSNDASETVYHPATECSNDEVLSHQALAADTTNDVIQYLIETANFGLADAGQVHHYDLEITGYWTHAGLTDELSDGYLMCAGRGARSGTDMSIELRGTGTSDCIDSKVYTEYNHFKGGDSGAPVLDDEVDPGKLAYMHLGSNSSFFQGHWDIGVSGDQVLQSLHL